MSIGRRSVAALSVGALAATGILGVVAGAGASEAKTVDATTPTSAQFSFSLTISGTSVAPETITGTGQADFTHGRVAADVTLPSGAEKGATGPTSGQVVVAGSTLYASVPGLTNLIGGMPWVSLSGPAADAAGVSSGESQVAAALANPSALVAKARSLGAAVSSLGTRTEHGQRQTGSAIDVNVAKVLANLPGLSAAQRHAVGAATVTVDVWTDPTGRLAELSVATQGSSASGAVSLRVDVGNYDAPVSITVPSPSATHALSSAAISQLVPVIESALGIDPTTSGLFSHLSTALSSPPHHPRADPQPPDLIGGDGRAGARRRRPRCPPDTLAIRRAGDPTHRPWTTGRQDDQRQSARTSVEPTSSVGGRDDPRLSTAASDSASGDAGR